MTGPQRQTLHARAVLLAQELDPPEAELELVEFTVGGSRYGFESSDLAGVFDLVHVTPLPGTPPFVAGLVALRGRMLSVLDLSVLLGLPPGPRVNPKILLLAGPSELGLAVDSVTGTTRVPRSGVSLVSGRYEIGTVGGTTLLDSRRIAEDPSIVVYQGATP